MNKTVLSALALAPACAQGLAQTMDMQPPHIVLILCDDMGYSDLGCYGGEVETPNIDSLAEHGCRFTNFTVAGRSCPSRASLMTGYYPHEAGMGWMANVDQGPDYPGYRGQISSEIPTLAEVMKENGYSAYMAGKWHLTLKSSYDGTYDIGPNGSLPCQRGFDRYYGSLDGNAGYYNTTNVYDDLTPVTSLPDDFYYTTAITDSVVSFINQHDADTPMFLYVAHQAPHLEGAAPAERIEKCRARYEAGFDVLREARFAKMKELGIIPDSLDLPTFASDYSGSYPTWESLSETDKNNWVTYMATYAAMIEIVDDGVGEIIQTLRSKGMLDNTVFFFLSDNGASNEYYGTVGQIMASLSNTPFRNFKSKCYNGGTFSPLIVSYGDPGKDKTNSRWTAMDGQWTDQRAHLIDILPTCVEMADGTYPTTYKNGEALPGISLVQTLEGEEPVERDLYFEHETSMAVIDGDWKLVRNTSSSSWELIDLANDPFEQTNVSSSYSAVVSELEAAWDTWATETNVYPLETRGWTARINYYTSLYPNQTGIDGWEEETDSLFISSIGDRVAEHADFEDGGLYAIKNVGVPGSDVTNTNYQGWLYIDTNNYMRIAGDKDTDPIGLSERHVFTIEIVDAAAGTYRFRTANDRYMSASGSASSLVSSTTEPTNAVYTLTKNTRDEVVELDAWYFDTGSLRIKPNNSNSSYSADYLIFDAGQPQLDSWYIYPVTLELGEEEGEAIETVQLPDGQYALTGWKQNGTTTPGLIYYDPSLSGSRYYRIDTDVQYAEGETPGGKYVWILVNDEDGNSFTLQNQEYGVYIPANASNGMNFSGSITANLQLMESGKEGDDGSPAYYVTMTNYTGSGTSPYWYINEPDGDPNLSWYYSADVTNGSSACMVTFHSLTDTGDGESPVGIEAITATDGAKKFYDLQGRRVLNPTRGTYIVRTGTKAYKVYINE